MSPKYHQGGNKRSKMNQKLIRSLFTMQIWKTLKDVFCTCTSSTWATVPQIAQNTHSICNHYSIPNLNAGTQHKVLATANLIKQSAECVSVQGFLATRQTIHYVAQMPLGFTEQVSNHCWWAVHYGANRTKNFGRCKELQENIFRPEKDSLWHTQHHWQRTSPSCHHCTAPSSSIRAMPPSLSALPVDATSAESTYYATLIYYTMYRMVGNFCGYKFSRNRPKFQFQKFSQF